MKAIRLSQIVWAGLLVLLLLGDALAVELVATGTLLVLAAMYLVAVILALGSNRLAWATALVMPVIICATAALHALSVAEDKSQYIDSRAATYLVLLNTLLFIFPLLILLALFWRHRAELLVLFRAPTTGAA